MIYFANELEYHSMLIQRRSEYTLAHVHAADLEIAQQVFKRGVVRNDRRLPATVDSADTPRTVEHEHEHAVIATSGGSTALDDCRTVDQRATQEANHQASAMLQPKTTEALAR